MPYLHSPKGDIFWGSLMSDPQVHYAEDRSWVTFRLLYDYNPENYFGSANITCYCNGSLANYAKYLRRGTKIIVCGIYRERQFESTRKKDKGKIITYQYLNVGFMSSMPPLNVWAWLCQNTAIDIPAEVTPPAEWEVDEQPDVGF